jgi:hypothetical protein
MITPPTLIGVNIDEYQRRRITLPRGDLPLGDGRVLRPIIGYDVRKITGSVMNEETRKSILESAGWRHGPTGLLVTASVDNTPRWGALIHVAMSHPHIDPSWEEIKLVKDAFFPSDMDAAMILPKKADYVNVHSHCFHLWQLPQEWGLL